MQNSKLTSLAAAKADWRRVQSDVAYVRMLMAGLRWVEAVQRAEKFNANHDELGRFTFADGAVVPASGRQLGDGSAAAPGDQGAGANDGNVRVAQAEGEGGNRLDAPANGTNRSGEIASRGSFRTQTLNDAWNNAVPGPNGGRMCTSGCGRELMGPPNSGTPRDWDVSHNPSWSNRTFPAGTERPAVRDNYQSGTQLECTYCNRSGGNNDGRFPGRLPLSEGNGGHREVPPFGGGGGGGGIPEHSLRLNE